MAIFTVTVYVSRRRVELNPAAAPPPQADSTIILIWDLSVVVTFNWTNHKEVSRLI